MFVDGAHVLEHGVGRGHWFGAGGLHDAIEPLALDDGVKKDGADRVTCWFRVGLGEAGQQIVDDAQAFAGQYLGDIVGDGAVAGKDDFAVDF